MKHIEKTKSMSSYHDAMQQKLKDHDTENLPPSVKLEKLEAAYDKLQNYVYKLVPKSTEHTN